MNNNYDIMQSFTFVDTNPGYKAPVRLPINEVHVYRRKRYSLITFSAQLIPEFERAGIQSVRLAKNNFTGDYALVFTSGAEGHTVHYKSWGRKAAKNSLRVTSATLVDALFRAFDMPDGSDYLELELSSDNSRRPDVKFFTIQKIDMPKI